MTAASIIPYFLILLLVPGCIGSAEKKTRESVIGTLPEIKKDCTLCHTSPEVKKGAARLKKPLSALCLDCHPDRNSANEHKVDIVPTMEIKELPLFDGKMTCVTCHDPHWNKYGSLLRTRKSDLCMQCHPY